MTPDRADRYRRSLLGWGGVAGFGAGAVVDVVVFHLVVQHHHLLSGYVDPGTAAGLRTNLFYDGLFLLGMLAVTAAGVVALWRTANGTSVRLSPSYVLGAVVLGAALFNVVDGTVTHYVLDAHDVVHGTVAWNPHWIVVSAVLLVLGGAILRWSPGPRARSVATDGVRCRASGESRNDRR